MSKSTKILLSYTMGSLLVMSKLPKLRFMKIQNCIGIKGGDYPPPHIPCLTLMQSSQSLISITKILTHFLWISF